MTRGHETTQPINLTAQASVQHTSAVKTREATLDSIRALMMIRAYRVRGHLKANLDPLGLEVPTEHPELDPKTYGFSEKDMDREVFINYVLGLETATVREIISVLQETYWAPSASNSLTSRTLTRRRGFKSVLNAFTISPTLPSVASGPSSTA